jgi:dienelactone hydrolase
VRDAVGRGEKFPLIALSHGFGSFRCQSTFLCTHLASHGYVVASVDHTGNTIMDIMQMIMAVQSGEAVPEPTAAVGRFIELRPADVGFMIEQVAAAPEIGAMAQTDRIGMTGHSFGGWTTLAYTARDRRVRAALPLAPAGGKTWMPAEALRQALKLDWDREVPTLYLVAEGDSLPPPRRHADSDGRASRRGWLRVAPPTTCTSASRRGGTRCSADAAWAPSPRRQERRRSASSPSEHAYLFNCGLGLAHMDAHLKGNESAAQLLAGDLVKLMAERGVSVGVV